MNNFKRYYDAVAYIEGLSSNLSLGNAYMSNVRHLGFYLKRMNYFLSLIGNPHKNLKVIHITGTAGKGSVTNMTHEVLHAAGYNVGSFTSPFTSTSIEKIRVGEHFISADEFADITEYLIPFIDKAYMEGRYGRPSYFEIFFAIALLYFKHKNCTWAVLEVGLGGRYDATNIIERPVVTAITSIDYDHMEILGNTLTKIAYDKAGIIKRGSRFYTTEQRPALKKLLKEVCKQKGASYCHVPSTSIIGANSSLVTVIATSMGIPPEHIARGISNSKLPCRFELIQLTPRVYIDGAHNPVKMRHTALQIRPQHYKKLHLVMGMAENKDCTPILKEIVPLADTVTFTRFQSKDRKAAHPKMLLKKTRGLIKKGSAARVRLHPTYALEEVLSHATKDDLVVITGSFFLAGELRKYWVTEEEILRNRKLY